MTALFRRFFCAFKRYVNGFLIGDFFGISGLISFFAIPDDEGISALAILLLMVWGITIIISIALPSCVINKS